MAVAYAYFKNDHVLKKMQCWWCLLLGFVCTFGGFAINSYKWGWAFSDLLDGAGLFILAINLGVILGKIGFISRVLAKIGAVAYEMFLLHHYFLNYLLMPLLLIMGWQNEWGFWVFMPVFFMGSVWLGQAGNYLSLLMEGVKMKLPGRM